MAVTSTSGTPGPNDRVNPTITMSVTMHIDVQMTARVADLCIRELMHFLASLLLTLVMHIEFFDAFMPFKLLIVIC